MVSESRLLEVVDQAFRTTARGLDRWPDRHADPQGGRREPFDEEYSRLTDPARYRLIEARVDAWIAALEELGVASCRRRVNVGWSTAAARFVTRTDRLAAHRS